MRLPSLDSRLEKITDITWSVARTIGFADVMLRSAEGWLYNTPQTPAVCMPAPPSSCAPKRDPLTDVYAGFALYTATALALGCMSVTLASVMRKPDNLSYRAATWQGRELRPARRGVLTLPRDELGWAANTFRAAVLCVGHAIVTYNKNEGVRNSHGYRLGVGCLAGAGLVLLYVGARSYGTQRLPDNLHLGRNTKVPRGALMNAIGDFKTWCMLHIGAAFTFSGLAASLANPVSDPWHYRSWGAPVLTGTGVVALLTGAALFGATLAMHNRALYCVDTQAERRIQPPALSIEEIV